MNSENENLISDGTGENVLLGIMESSRNFSEAIDIPTPLDDILRNVYDLHPNTKDFNPGLNSTMSENRLFNAGINSVANSFNLNFPDDASLYVTSQSNNATDSSSYVSAHSNSVTDSSIFVTTMLNNTSDYQSTSSLPYSQPAENTDLMEYLMNQKMYNMATTSTSAIDEEDNDPSPVYLNFNLQNISQPTQTFNSELEKISDQMANRETENKIDTLKYVEFINDVKEEAVQSELIDSNAERNSIFRQSTIIMTSPQLGKCSLQQISDVTHDIERTNENTINRVPTTYQPLNNSLTSITEFQRPDLNIQRNVIIRKPLQTKLTTKQKLTNLEWAFINKNNNIIENSDEISNADFSSIENIVPDIPFIRYRPRNRERKQILDVLSESEISFMNTKGEFSVLSAEQTLTLPDDSKKSIINSSFVTFRKKIKPIETYTEPIEENPITTVTQNTNLKSSNRRDIATTSSSIPAEFLLISSDSESEDDNLQSNEIKCLKCNNCKKMFKTARSYSIHKKRCDAPSFVENPHVIEVEYLESEKEDEIEPTSSSEISEPHPNRTLTVRKKSLAESDSIESLVVPKDIVESDRNDEYVTRRNTRSSQKTFNSNASLSSSSTASRLRSKKPKLSITDSVKNNTPKNKMFSCDICGKKFRLKSHLIAHQRIHDKNYKCQYCFKIFEIKTAYDSHVMEKCEKIPAVKLKKLRLAMGSK